MATKIPRKTAVQFGTGAGFQQIAQFGSLAAAAIAYSTDPAVIQGLSNWVDGWFSAILGGNSPAIEDMNAMSYVFGYQLSYITQAGIPEWDAGTEYFVGSLVTGVGTGIIYVSLTNSNLNNAVSVAADWMPYTSMNAVSINPTTQSPYVMTTSDNGKTFLVNSANGAQTFTLPAPIANFTFTVKDSGNDAYTNNITINHNASEKINGQNSYVIGTTYGAVTIVSDGTNWFTTSLQSANGVVVGPVCSTISSNIADGLNTFQNFSTSPTLTFVPLKTGIHKVEANPVIYQHPQNDSSFRINNTSGGGTLLSNAYCRSAIDVDSNISSKYMFALYYLVAGTSYVFDVQAANVTGDVLELRGDYLPFSMIVSAQGN